MRFDVAKDGATVTVKFEGKLNFVSNQDFQTMLGEAGKAGGSKVVFDLSGLTHIDSVGLGLLYIAKEDLEGLGLRLSLASPNGNVLRLLELTEANKTFDITQ